MNFNLLTFFKGIIVGGTMLVPGVSGGSMAMILGIYQRLLSSISSFFHDWKHNACFLATFLCGGIIGVVLFANPLLKLIENHRMIMLYFFIGAATGGIPLMLKNAQLGTFQWKYILYLILGILFIIGLNFLPTGLFQQKTGQGGVETILLVIAGIISAVALVLPGISVSYFLLLLGLYDQTIAAITTGNLVFLFSLGIGFLLGVLATTKVLEWIMSSFPQATYLVILGFILGSLAEIFPGIPSKGEIVLSLALFLAGFVFIYLLSQKELLYIEKVKNID